MQYFKSHLYAANPAHYNKFLIENENAIGELHNLIKTAIDIYNGDSDKFKNSIHYVLSTNKFNLFGENTTSSREDINNYLLSLFPEEQLKSIQKIFDKHRSKVRGFNSDYNLQLFGLVKTGEEAKRTLQNEIEGSHAFSYIGDKDGTSNKLMFDIRSAINVGFDLGYKDSHNEIMSNLAEGENLMIEVSTILVRFMSSDRYLSNQSLFNEAIIDTIVSRMILLKANFILMIKMMHDSGIFRSERIKERYSIGKTTGMDIASIMKCLVIYKTVFDSVNNISTFTVAKGIEDVISYLKIALRYTSTPEGLTNAYSVLVRPAVNAEQHGVRYIDYLLEDIFRRLDKCKRSRIDLDGASYQPNGLNIDTGRINTGLESVLEDTAVGPIEISIDNIKEFDSLKDDLKIAISKLLPEDTIEDIINEELNEPAIVSFEGMEAKENLADLTRKTRGQLLTQLKPNASSRYRKLEAEAIKLKADAMNCNDVNTQSVILRKMSAFVRILGVYRNQHGNDPIFLELVSLLDDDIYAIRNSLSERNFFQERNTRLYGVARADLSY